MNPKTRPLPPATPPTHPPLQRVDLKLSQKEHHQPGVQGAVQEEHRQARARAVQGAVQEEHRQARARAV